MDTRALLDSLLNSTQAAVKKGQNAAESRLGMPAEGEERDAMVKGLKTGALAAGAMALLLGTKTGRKVGGTALKLGSIAALGGLGYKAFQQWQSSQSQVETNDAPQFIDKLAPPQAQSRSISLLKAMIAAAKADGHIDAEERNKIMGQIEQAGLGADAEALIRGEIDKPLDPKAVAAEADSTESAVEIYLTSRLMIDRDNTMESAYLDQLANALSLDASLVEQLESEIAAS